MEIAISVKYFLFRVQHNKVIAVFSVYTADEKYNAISDNQVDSDNSQLHAGY